MAVTAKIKHKNGTAGGYLVGRRHSQGGIKAVNIDNDAPLEVESDEVIITRKAVLSDQKHEFNGRAMTNIEILSAINEQGGGVSLMEQGGKTDGNYACKCSGARHNYNGQDLTDREILAKMEEGGHSCGCHHADNSGQDLPGVDMAKKEEGGHTCGCQHADDVPKLPHDLLPHQHPDQFKKGGSVKKIKEPLPEGGIGAFRGINYQYENPYDLNRAIESLLDSRPDNDFDASEKRFLKYYSGYGGLQKYGASGVGILYEYFTPGEIAKRMWGLAYKYGYQGGRVLEPSCGTGEFFNYAPETAEKTGYEINPYSYRIAGILHPTVDLQAKHFEEIFIRNRDTIRNKIDSVPKYDLVIGNPPYGNFQGKFAGMGEKTYTHASNYVDYFIFRGLDLLVSGGLLVYVIGVEVAAGGVPFLAQKMTPVKREISEKSILLDAYRLPNGVFDRTDVLTDIIVLKKK